VNEERNTDIQDRAELTDKHKTQKKKRKTIDIRRNFPNKKKKKRRRIKCSPDHRRSTPHMSREVPQRNDAGNGSERKKREREERASTERREKRSNKENFSRSSVAYLFVLGHGLWPTGHDPPSMTQHATNGTVCT
jgi:hypothetical protein